MNYNMKQIDFFKELPEYLHNKNHEFMQKVIGTINANLHSKQQSKLSLRNFRMFLTQILINQLLKTIIQTR